jgi:hypothetical protein
MQEKPSSNAVPADDDGVIDLAELDTKKGAEEGYELELRSPTGEPIGQYVTVIGRDSEKYQERQRAIERKNANRLFKRGRLAAGDDDQEDDAISLLVLATKSWRTKKKAGVLRLRGQEIPFTKDNAREVYAGFPDIRDQVSTAIMDRANFLPKSGAA